MPEISWWGSGGTMNVLAIGGYLTFDLCELCYAHTTCPIKDV